MSRFLPFILGFALVSCNKNAATPSTRQLIGTWVDTQLRADTLFIYRENGQTVLFDNSMAYRSFPDPSSVAGGYTWKIDLADGNIRCSPWQLQYDDDYSMSYPFTWITEGKKFQIESRTFRPYISCVGCKRQFERVK